MTSAPALSAWLDDFFQSYYRQHPVNATFIGIHQHDHELPDYSEHGLGDTLSSAGSLLTRLHTLPNEPQSDAEAIDRELAEGFLTIQRWELTSAHFQRGNPALYSGEAIFGLMSLLRQPFAPLNQRLEATISRMQHIPELLKQGQRNILSAPTAWTERAIDECGGALALLGNGIDWLIQEHGTLGPQLRRAADQAAVAFAEYQHHLESELRQQPSQAHAAGAEAFDLLLRRGHNVTMTATEIESYAHDQFATTEAYLSEHARDFGVTTPQAALALLADIHPPIGQYYARYTEIWNDCRATAEHHQLLTWPEYPIRYVPQPIWARSAAPHLYFLFYHSPAPFDALPVVEYLVTPIDPEMPSEEQTRRLRATNQSVIKLNHVVHHGAIGHHVQNWHAFRAASRIGQIAAVDCASRIALFCGGTLAEGWACYATDLMAEFGFLTPLEQYAERHTRMRMAARALIDVRLHHSIISLDEAATFYHERVGMSASAARAEATRNSMFPCTALMYLIGTDTVHHLRRDMATRAGFHLRTFHNRLLSYGSIPVALIAKLMRAQEQLILVSDA